MGLMASTGRTKTPTQAFSQSFLPLSWREQASFAEPHFRRVVLPLRSGLEPTHWITFADLPPTASVSALHALLQDYLQHQGIQRWVIRGVHPRFFEPLKVEALLTGREALLHLKNPEHVHRRSIRALARRGLRHGQITHFQLHQDDLPTELLTAYQHLKAEVALQHQVPLAHMYRRSLAQSDRLWIFCKTGSDQMLGAISVIAAGRSCWHTEVLMRDSNAPVGIMEALVQRVFEDLAREGFSYWSLGEVPFYPTAPPQDLKTRAIVYTGQRIEFAYRARGLLAFKQKFNPLWRPVYLCGSPRLYWPDLASMFWSSQASRLVLQKALAILKGKENL